MAPHNYGKQLTYLCLPEHIPIEKVTGREITRDKVVGWGFIACFTLTPSAAYTWTVGHHHHVIGRSEPYHNRD
ncbi:hypothetical protein J6590_017367 [Homalodisca vitripennis]|nr:hypothetical protein J6590_017367 [Homalodisca vitripennis]